MPRRYIRHLPRVLDYAIKGASLARDYYQLKSGIDAVMAPIRKHGKRGRSRSRTPSASRSRSPPKAPRKKRRSRFRVRKVAHRGSFPRLAQKAEETGQHNELNESYISVSNGVIPKRYKGVVKGALQHQYGSQYKQAASGQQFVYVIGNIMTLSQVTGSSQASGVTTRDSWPCNPFDLNPYQATTGGGLLTSLAVPSNDRMYFHSIKGEIDLTGLETITQEVTLYLVKYKITTNNDMPTMWNDVLDASSAGINQAAAVQGTVAAAATYGRPFNSTYGQAWTSHPTMRKAFKIMATRKVTLTPGSTHKFKYNVKYNRMIDREYFMESAATNEYVKGFTMSWVMVMKGAPIWESTTAKMTPGPVDVGFQHTYTAKVSFPMEKRLYAYRTDAGFISASTLTNDKIIIDTDTVSNVNQI